MERGAAPPVGQNPSAQEPPSTPSTSSQPPPQEGTGAEIGLAPHRPSIAGQQAESAIEAQDPKGTTLIAMRRVNSYFRFLLSASFCFNSLRNTFPVRPNGSCSTNSISRGYS